MRNANSQNVALIGLGAWGKNILRELCTLGSEVVVLLYSKNEDKERFLKREYPRVRSTYDKTAVQKDNHISHVVIATPIATHYALAREFMGLSKSVFLEKPITSSAAEGDDLLMRAHATRTPFFAGHIFLYHECFERLRAELRGKTITAIRMIKSARLERGALTKELFLDAFIHETAAALSLFGKPQEIRYRGAKEAQDVQQLLEHRVFSIEMAYPHCVVSAMITPPRAHKARVWEFTAGNTVYRWENDGLSLRRESVPLPLCIPDIPPLRRELDIFLNHYASRSQEIKRNNYIAVEAVRLLEAAAVA